MPILHEAHVQDYLLYRLFGDQASYIDDICDVEYYSAIAEFLIP
jgi:hypothetical protein